jgi:hypothetical protein
MNSLFSLHTFANICKMQISPSFTLILNNCLTHLVKLSLMLSSIILHKYCHNFVEHTNLLVKYVTYLITLTISAPIKLHISSKSKSILIFHDILINYTDISPLILPTHTVITSTQPGFITLKLSNVITKPH